MSRVYGPNTEIVNQAQFLFRRFRSNNIDIKGAQRSRSSIVENADTTVEIIGSDHLISTTSIGQRSVWNHLGKAGCKSRSCHK